MCFPFEGHEEDLTIGPRASKTTGAPQLTITTYEAESDLIGDSPDEREEIDRDRSNRRERERRMRQIRDLGSVFDAIDAGATSPFGVFGPRLGVESISDVRPGERGRSVTIADLKRGL